MSPNLMHALERTSPKGTPFVGTCLKCGERNLTLHDQQTKECPNPSGMTPDIVLAHIIRGPERE